MLPQKLNSVINSGHAVTNRCVTYMYVHVFVFVCVCVCVCASVHAYIEKTMEKQRNRIKNL